MSGFSPSGGGQNPFENIFGDIARALGGANSGPLNWEVARQVSVMIAADGAAEANVDPKDRMRIENLIRVAELQVGQVTGFDAQVTDLRVVNRTEWASHSFDAWKPLLESLATSLGSGNRESEATATPDPTNPFAALANMEQFLGPVLLGMQVGGMVGQLSRKALGQYDFPIPREGRSVQILASNLSAFAEDWSLPIDELSLYATVEELTRTVIMNRPHVRARFGQLFEEYVSGFQPDSAAMQERLAGLELTDPNDLPSLLGDPQSLLGAIQTDAQRRTLLHLSALIAAFVGYVDHVLATVAGRVIPSVGSIAEAVKRRRVEESDGQRLVEQLLGLELSQATFDRGDAFIKGVLERAGEDGLNRLWQTAAELPTPADVDAPGLWLARIGVDVPFDES